MGRTAFQILKDKISGPPELKLCNPLHLTIGQMLRLNVIDLNDMTFTVTGVRECSRANTDPFADYEIKGLGTGTREQKDLKLRMFPMDRPDPVSGLTHDIIVLSLYYECSYMDSQGIRDALAVSESTGEFEIDWNGKTKYFRLNPNVKSKYNAGTRVITEGLHEPKCGSFSYWDYHTQLTDEAGQPFVRYLFVEVDEDGMYQLWIGNKIDPLQVSVM